MIQIENLDADSKQDTTVVLADGSAIVFSLVYRPTPQRWFIDVVYSGRTIRALGLSLHPNLLRGFRDVLPFGLMCFSTDGTDPATVEDFSSGRVLLFVLDSTNGGTEVERVEGDFFS